MDDKFTFIHKNNDHLVYTAQKSFDGDGKILVMWIGDTGNICGSVYDENQVEMYINTRDWIVLEILNPLEM